MLVPAEPAELAAAAERILTNPELRRSMQEAGIKNLGRMGALDNVVDYCARSWAGRPAAASMKNIRNTSIRSANIKRKAKELMKMSASNDVRVVKVGNVSVGGGTLAVAAGPCVLDTFDEALMIAKTMKEYCAEFGFGYIFKASFDKANRTSITSYRGPGIEKGSNGSRRSGARLAYPSSRTFTSRGRPRLRRSTSTCSRYRPSSAARRICSRRRAARESRST